MKRAIALGLWVLVGSVIDPVSGMCALLCDPRLPGACVSNATVTPRGVLNPGTTVRVWWGQLYEQSVDIVLCATDQNGTPAQTQCQRMDGNLGPFDFWTVLPSTPTTTLDTKDWRIPTCLAPGWYKFRVTVRGFGNSVDWVYTPTIYVNGEGASCVKNVDVSPRTGMVNQWQHATWQASDQVRYQLDLCNSSTCWIAGTGTGNRYHDYFIAPGQPPGLYFLRTKIWVDPPELSNPTFSATSSYFEIVRPTPTPAPTSTPTPTPTPTSRPTATPTSTPTRTPTPTPTPTPTQVPLPVLTLHDSNVRESDGMTLMGFTVTVSPAPDAPITVYYHTADGAAFAHADYTPTSGSLTFAPGKTSKTFVVPVVGDVVPESTEGFSVVLYSPSGATLAKATATATIHDDDPGTTPSNRPMYRLVIPGGNHFYTTDWTEYNYLGTLGWGKEGVAFTILSDSGVYGGISTVPLFRLSHPTAGHHWTTDVTEAAAMTSTGWTFEGIIGYMLPTPAAGTTPLYRLVYPPSGWHLWTIDPTEYWVLPTYYGWSAEGVAAYVIP